MTYHVYARFLFWGDPQVPIQLSSTWTGGRTLWDDVRAAKAAETSPRFAIGDPAKMVKKDKNTIQYDENVKND